MFQNGACTLALPEPPYRGHYTALLVNEKSFEQKTIRFFIKSDIRILQLTQNGSPLPKWARWLYHRWCEAALSGGKLP